VNPLHLRLVVSFALATLVVVTGWVGVGMLDTAMALRSASPPSAAQCAAVGTEARPPDLVAQRHIGRLTRLGRAVILGGTSLVFLLAVLVNVSLVRALREREAAQRIVAEQAAALQRQTAVLLRHERELGDRLVDQQHLSAALQRSNEDLDQFAYATSHDLKAPLRGITNLATWVEEDLGGAASAAVREHLRMLRSRAHRLEALIEGILAYARAGRARDEAELVDVQALVNETIELIEPPPGCIITVETPLPHLVTERVPLQQVLMNLLQNAIKHGCPSGRGEIAIAATRREGGWTFSVRDEGPGIPSEFQQRIFGVFQTLAPRDQVEGTGIGLAVVKKVIESRGGRIEVRSSSGEGATFRFSWPAVAEGA
jgi:signal transduction histidine kinase